MVSIKSLRRDLVRAAFYLLQVRERNIYKALGFSRIADYAAEVGGLSPRQCRDFLAVARKLPRFDGVQTALEEGRLSWSQARRICAQATPEDEEYWLTAAGVAGASPTGTEGKVPPAGAERTGRIPAPPQSSRKPVKPLQPPARHKPASPPAAIPETRPALEAAKPPQLAKPIPAERDHVVSLKFTGEQYSRWQAVSALPRQGGDLSEAVLAGLAGGGQKGSVLDIQIVRIYCPACRRAVLPTSRGEIAVEKPMLAAGNCDATIENENGQRRRTIAPRLRRAAFRRARYRCEKKGCPQAAFLTLHHRRPLAVGGTNSLENLIVLCWKCHQKLHADEDSARRALRAGR